MNTNKCSLAALKQTHHFKIDFSFGAHGVLNRVIDDRPGRRLVTSKRRDG